MGDGWGGASQPNGHSKPSLCIIVHSAAAEPWGSLGSWSGSDAMGGYSDCGVIEQRCKGGGGRLVGWLGGGSGRATRANGQRKAATRRLTLKHGCLSVPSCLDLARSDASAQCYSIRLEFIDAANALARCARSAVAERLSLLCHKLAGVTARIVAARCGQEVGGGCGELGLRGAEQAESAWMTWQSHWP